MITRNRAIGILLSAVAVLVLVGSSAQAQSSTRKSAAKKKGPSSSGGYGAMIARGYTNRNSAARFSSSYIRNQLTARSVRGSVNPLTPATTLGSYTPLSARKTPKPFSSISRRPTVSPYLALSNSFNQVSDYYNLVRPQQQQRRVNQQLQRQNQANQHRLNQLAAKGPYNPRGNENAAPTGHSAVFQSYGTYLNTNGYYSGAPVPR